MNNRSEPNKADTGRPRVSVVIPSWSGEVSRLLASLRAQTYNDYEVIVVRGVSPAGRARNQGVARARGELIVFIDDDAYFGNERVLEKLVTSIDADPLVGIVGTSKLIPPDATWMQRRIAAEVPRWIYPCLSEDTQSNPPLDRYGFTGITTTCCILRRSVFENAGGFDEQLTTGPEDTEFFYRVRREGYRFLIPAHCWVYHEPPKSIGALLRKSVRYGLGHAQEARKNPERNLDVARFGQWYGVLVLLFSPLLFLPSIFASYYLDPEPCVRFGFRPLKALSTYATLYSYAWGWFRLRAPKPEASQTCLPPAAPTIAASASQSSLITAVAFVGISVVNYLYANVMAWLLPVHAFGVLGLAQSYLLIAATLLNSGFPWGLARGLSRNASVAEAYRQAKSALIGNLAVALAVGLALIAATTYMGLHFGPEGSSVVPLILIETVLLAIAAVWAGVLQGTLRFVALNVGRFIEACIKLVGGVTMVLLGLGANGAVGAIVAGTAVLVILLGRSTRRFSFWHERSWGTWESYRGSLAIFGGLCSLAIIGNFDIIGLKLFSSASNGDTLAGLYQAATVLPRIPVLLSGAFAAVLFPYVARARDGELSLYLFDALRYAILLIIPLDLILIAIPQAAIAFVFPAAYQTSANALRIVAAASGLLSVATIITTMFQARGLARTPVLWLFVAAAAEVVGLALLVPTYGIEGAASALLIASSVACGSAGFSFLWHFGRRLHPLALDALKYCCVSIAFVGMLVVLPHPNHIWTVMSVLTALVIYLLLLSLVRLLRPADLTTLTAGLPVERVPRVAALQLAGVRLVERLNQMWAMSDTP